MRPFVLCTLILLPSPFGRLLLLEKRLELIEAPLSKKPSKTSQKVATVQSKDAACPPFQRQVSRGDPVISFVPKYFYTPPSLPPPLPTSLPRVDPSIRSLAHTLLGSAVICIHNLSPIAPTLSRHDAA